MNQPNFIKDTDSMSTDQEPGGVFHSMIAQGKYLYVVETNRGFLLRVDPKSGIVEKLYDMSVSNKEHNPIVMARRGNEFHVGTFGEDDGPAELAVFDKHFAGYSLPFETLNRIVAWRGAAINYSASRSSPWTLHGYRTTAPTSSRSIPRPASGRRYSPASPAFPTDS